MMFWIRALRYLLRVFTHLNREGEEVAGFAAGIHTHERIGQKDDKGDSQWSPPKRGRHP